MDKREWRAKLAEQRAGVPASTHAAEAAALAEAAAALAGGRTVCAYVPFGGEPGSIALLEGLRVHAVRVLLPIVPTTPGPLDWAVYTGADSLAPGRLRGVLEPTGRRLGPAAIATADRLLLPALAVDHSGVRLGRGAGYYDRSLGLAGQAEFVAVIRDAELVARLPADRHDVRVHAALTPGRGLVPLPCSPVV